MANQGEQRRCSALLEGKKARCQSWTSDRSNEFCSRHKEERWRLVRAYKDAGDRATALKPTAVTTKEQLYALYSVDHVTAAVTKTKVYLEELREELNGRTAVSKRFYTNGVPDGHHVRIRNLTNEEIVVAALLRELELRARTMRTSVPRQPLRPVAVNRGAPTQRDYEYSNRQYRPVDYGRRPYGQPVGNGGMPGRPGPSLGDVFLRWTLYAIIGYGAYKVVNFMFFEVIQVCRRIMAPFTDLVRLIASGRLFSGVGEQIQALGTMIGEQAVNITREKLKLAMELSEHRRIQESILEKARKGIVECSVSTWASLSQLASKGVGAASEAMAPSVSDPGQDVKNAAEGLTEVGSWILGRSGAIQASVSKLVGDGAKAAGDVVTSSINDPGKDVKNAVKGLTEARGWIVERSGPMWKSLSQLVEDGAKAASEAVASSVGGQVKK